MELLNDFLMWAWERHHNILSWYIRPLFILPLALFSYRRSPRGIALTLVALVTSMFWFPAPERPDPSVEGFLRMEAQFVTNPTPARVLMVLLAPIGLGSLCVAFWKRSLAWGVAIINAVALGKIAWSVAEGSTDGLAVIPPAIVGLLICDVTVLYVARRAGKRILSTTSRHM